MRVKCKWKSATCFGNGDGGKFEMYKKRVVKGKMWNDAIGIVIDVWDLEIK